MNITAVQVFAKALGLTEAELFKQMEQGKLISSEVLPKVALAYKEAAEAGGAYAKSLEGLRVTEGQFLTQTQRAGKTIFNSGFEKGLSNLYDTMALFLKDSEPQLKKLGKVFGKVFDGLAHTLNVFEPFIRMLIDNMELAFGAAMVYKITTFTAAIRAAFLSALAPVTLLIASIEELATLFSDKMVGGLERSLGMQVNLMTGQSRGFSEKDGVFTDTGEVKNKWAQGFNLKDMYPVASSTYDLVGEQWERMFPSNNVPQSAPNVTINNSFPNVDVDSYKRIQEQSYHDAIYSQSK